MAEKTEKTIKEILVCTRELLSAPGAWIRGASATDVEGATVDPSDPNACYFCTIGGLARCTGDGHQDDYSIAYALVQVGADLGERETLSYWNDNLVSGQAEVLAAFDRAIALLP